MDIKLKYTYKESNILEGSFNIPRMLDRIYISYNSSIDLGNYGLTLIITDPNKNARIKKLLAKEETVVLSQSSMETSVGGLAGPILEGEWRVKIVVFTEYLKEDVIKSGFEITLNISEEGKDIEGFVGENTWSTPGAKYNTNLYDWNKVYSQEKRWFKGDFHTHTNLSDGKETVSGVTKKAKDMNLDFYVPTEHNLVHTGWVDTDICILPGIEITTDKGHFNMFGITEEPDYIMEIMTDLKEEYNNKIISAGYEKGNIISINHPFLTRWKWEFENTQLDKVHTIEIINDPTYPYADKSNDACIKFMDLLWNDGYKIYAVGGSDSHNLIDQYYEGAKTPSIAGDPATYVYMDKLTPNNILKSVKEGKTYVTRFCNLEFKIYSDTKSYLPGEEIVEEGTSKCVVITYELNVISENEEMDVFLVENGKYTKVERINNTTQSFKASIEFDDNYKWARLEVRNKKSEFRGLINPIYRGKKETTYKIFSKALENLEAEYD